MSISGTGCLGFLKDADDTCNLCRGTTEKNLSVTVPGELKSVKHVLVFPNFKSSVFGQYLPDEDTWVLTITGAGRSDGYRMQFVQYFNTLKIDR